MVTFRFRVGGAAVLCRRFQTSFVLQVYSRMWVFLFPHTLTNGELVQTVRALKECWRRLAALELVVMRLGNLIAVVSALSHIQAPYWIVYYIGIATSSSYSMYRLDLPSCQTLPVACHVQVEFPTVSWLHE